jgi:hypothetical protein
MHSSRFALFVGLLLTSATVATASDLTKTDRRLIKEPKYQSKAAKYCLLVFGPEAKTRVWLVQDHDLLYVDRNGNGDLTEEGERVVANKEGSDADERVFQFEAGDIRDGKLLHKGLSVAVARIDHAADLEPSVKEFLAKNPQGRGYMVSADVEMPSWKGGGLSGRVGHIVLYFDVRGVLQFADKPQDAPVIHFGGPWQVTLFSRHRLTAGREQEFVLVVGTRGVGPGTTAYVPYEGVVPDKIHPTVEIAYAPRRPGETPVRELHELKQRC